MNLADFFVEARKTLQVSLTADARAVRKSYRKMVSIHPPDRDPDGFRRVREAFERISDPLASTQEVFLRSTPLSPPPEVPDPSHRDLLKVHDILFKKSVRNLSALELLGHG